MSSEEKEKPKRSKKKTISEITPRNVSSFPCLVDIKFGCESKSEKGMPIILEYPHDDNQEVIGYDLRPDKEALEKIKEEKPNFRKKLKRIRREILEGDRKKVDTAERREVVVSRRQRVLNKIKEERKRNKETQREASEERNNAMAKAYDYIYYHRLMRFLAFEGFAVDEYGSSRVKMDEMIDSHFRLFTPSSDEEETAAMEPGDEIVQVDCSEVIREIRPDDMIRPQWQTIGSEFAVKRDIQKKWERLYEQECLQEEEESNPEVEPTEVRVQLRSVSKECNSQQIVLLPSDLFT
eukprot:m.179502 g.179502  ORF g.179502 m.179502 type:complete len:294 (+) comp39220_c0_seq3:48-929(+)